PFARGREHAPEQVYVERAAQATVGAHDDESHRLYRALDQEWMPIVGVCFIEVANHDAHLFRVRTSGAHAFLRATHLTRRHHFHGPGDLLSTFDTRDLDPNFFGARHSRTPPFSKRPWTRSPRRSS